MNNENIFSKACLIQIQASHYSATGIDPPEVVQFIRKYYPEVVFDRPKESFYTIIKRKGPPKIMYRWC